MTTEHLHFQNWQDVRDALEHAYKRLGLSMVQDGPNSLSYPTEHWNIAGLVHEYSIVHIGACITCKVPLTFDTVVRCLDCKATLCERCAPAHFNRTL